MLYDCNISNFNLCFMKVSLEDRVIQYAKSTLFIEELHPQIVRGSGAYCRMLQFEDSGHLLFKK